MGVRHLLILAALTATALAAAPPADPSDASFSATASADLVVLDADLAPGADPAAAALSVGATIASVGVATGSPDTSATATIVDPHRPGAPVRDAAEVRASQQAPADNDAPTTTRPGDDVAVDGATVGSPAASAHARWPSTAPCLPAGRDYATSSFDATRASLLDGLVTVDAGGDARGTTGTSSAIWTEPAQREAVRADGQDARTVLARAESDVTEVVVGDPAAPLLHLEVETSPRLTVATDGTSTEVDYLAPVVHVTSVLPPGGVDATLDTPGAQLQVEGVGTVALGAATVVEDDPASVVTAARAIEITLQPGLDGLGDPVSLVVGHLGARASAAGVVDCSAVAGDATDEPDARPDDDDPADAPTENLSEDSPEGPTDGDDLPDTGGGGLLVALVLAAGGAWLRSTRRP